MTARIKAVVDPADEDAIGEALAALHRILPNSNVQIQHLVETPRRPFVATMPYDE